MISQQFPHHLLLLTRYILYHPHTQLITQPGQPRHDWNTLLLDQYDGRGELWRVTMGLPKNYYELPGVWTVLDVYHDLQARRYHVLGLDTEEQSTRTFTNDVPNKRYFSPASLRRRSVR